MKKVIVVGGGLAGLIAAICIQRQGISTLVIEKKTYPFHRVCGEYISNEVKAFLIREGLFPSQYAPPRISRLQLTSVNGKAAEVALGMGGFGVSRYVFDDFLYQEAQKCGVEFLLQHQVNNITFQKDIFEVEVEGHSLMKAEVVIGAFGKRSRLDRSLDRSFLKKKSPYLGVKYHIEYDHPDDMISLHNFKDGYCGLSKIEEGKYNLCYLSARSNLKMTGDIDTMQKQVLYQNPYLEKVFEEANFLFDRPEVINEISFETKLPVEQHIIMCGDSAGMITPLCGNGMAIAIRGAYLAAQEVVVYFKDHRSRTTLESNYTSQWQALFENRLWVGRKIQGLFGSAKASNLAVILARHARGVTNYLVSKTHGNTF